MESICKIYYLNGEKIFVYSKCNNNTNNFKKQKTTILGNNNLFKVTNTLNKVWLIFV